MMSKNQSNSLPFTATYAPQHNQSLRKAFNRLFHDFYLSFRQSPHLKLFFSTFIVFLLLFSLLYSVLFNRPSEFRYGTLEIKPSTCGCPPPVVAHLFSNSILSTASFVARVTHSHTNSQHSAFNIHTLFRGPPRSIPYPIVIPHQYTSACVSYQNSLPPPLSTHTQQQSWLLVSGRLFHANQQSSMEELFPQFSNFSTPDFTRVLASGCTDASKDFTTRSSLYTIWLAPWNFLSAEVAHVIESNVDDDSTWWRLQYPWIEFSDAIESANLLSHRLLKQKRISSNHDSQQQQHPREEWWLSEGISVVAACKDRTVTLQKALQSWLRLSEVNEVVIVDWSSEKSIKTQLPKYLANDLRIVHITVKEQHEWILSRAYNLGVRFSTYSKLLKLDCDTFLSEDFFKAHVLTKDTFFAGDWRQLHSGIDDELHANGILHVHRDDFLAVGGYDERIITYGWDDSDIVERLAKIRTPRHLVYSKVQHIPHPASLRVINQHRDSLLSPDNPYAAGVEIQRNRLLMTRCNLPPWRAGLPRTTWNVRRENIGGNGSTETHSVEFSASAANYLTPASAMISDTDALDVAKRAIRLILHRYGVQLLPKTLDLEFYKQLIHKMAFPTQYAEVVLVLRGGCMAKLLAQLTSKHATAEAGNVTQLPPGSYVGWRLQTIWQFPDADCECKFSQVFVPNDDEILSQWIDNSNTLPNLFTKALEQPSSDVIAVLNKFDEEAKQKNVSEQVMYWTDESDKKRHGNGSRILMQELACDLSPSSRDASWREAIRDKLRRLVPPSGITEKVGESLEKTDPTLLDSDQLADSDSFSHVLDSVFVDHIKEVLTSPPILAMTAKWSGQQLAVEPRNFHLEKRAVVLTTAVHLADVFKKDDQGEDRLKGAVTEQVLRTIKDISGLIDTLFSGCPSPASEYLRAYPELNIIIASLLTCHSCVHITQYPA